MECESGATPSFMDGRNSWEIQGEKTEGGSMVLPEGSSVNLFLGLSKEMK